ncbi:hypothetical protein [Ochrobactrum quorumnocens]|uniref:hypothetical protein n=1 Tax=Ochrobactrum quorumnocens TaxID=271865 RepID=UPI003BA20C87
MARLIERYIDQLAIAARLVHGRVKAREIFRTGPEMMLDASLLQKWPVPDHDPDRTCEQDQSPIGI